MNEIDAAMSSPLARIRGATVAIAELPQIELPHAIRMESLVGSPNRRLKAKLAASVTATVPAVSAISKLPDAAMAAKLIDAPNSATAASSSCLALKAMPACQRSEGIQTVRTRMPIRIAATRASTNGCPSVRSSSA